MNGIDTFHLLIRKISANPYNDMIFFVINLLAHGKAEVKDKGLDREDQVMKVPRNLQQGLLLQMQ